MPRPKEPVLITGGGPVGLIVALILGRAGIEVQLFDQGDIVHSEPRAATIHPATLDQLDDLGIYKLVEPQGLICPIVNYYDAKELVGSFDHALLKGETRHPWVLQCEQDKVSRTVFEMTKSVPHITCHTESKVVDCAQDATGAEVVVEHEGGNRKTYRGCYLVGADGARSTIRKVIGVEFEGFTYPERFTITGTSYDFEQDGYALRNYISDPEEWYNLFKISWTGPPGVFRLVAPVFPHEPYEGPEALAMAQRKLQRFHPRAEPYEIVIYDSYVVSQRVAATFRKGRILLVGDSSHLNSPIGAMGMNSGIHDATNLAANLLRVLTGEEGDGALDRYARQRRHVATEHVQTATIANKQAMEQKDPVKRQQWRDDMKRRAEDPKLAFQFLMRTALIDCLRDAERIT